jgi:hypothetical protein
MTTEPENNPLRDINNSQSLPEIPSEKMAQVLIALNHQASEMQQAINLLVEGMHSINQAANVLAGTTGAGVANHIHGIYSSTMASVAEIADRQQEYAASLIGEK